MRTHIITLELRCGESVHLHILRCFKGLSFQGLLFFPKSQLAPSGHAGVIIRASSATLSRDHPQVDSSAHHNPGLLCTQY